MTRKHVRLAFISKSHVAHSLHTICYTSKWLSSWAHAICLVSLKITTVDDFKVLALCGLRNSSFNFLLYYTAPWVFLRLSMCFRVPHLFTKIPKIYHWWMDSGVHNASSRSHFAIKRLVTSLRKNLFEKCVAKMWSIFFICNTFLLLTSLVIVFVH